MSTNITYNGVVYTIPATNDVAWGEQVGKFLIAIPAGMLTKAGGAWTLTADLDFGVNYGLVARYLQTKTAAPALGNAFLKLAKTDIMSWRNNAGGADVSLAKNTSDMLTWAGIVLADLSSIQTLTNKTIAAGDNTITDLTTLNLSATAGITYSQLTLSDGDIP